MAASEGVNGSAEARLAELGIVLPTPAAPVASYVPVVAAGGLLFVSGQLPFGPSGLQLTGRLGRDRSLAEGIEAARLAAIMVLAQARAAVGSLDRIARVVKLTGFVSAVPEFTDAHKVVNGASDLIVAVFGEAGRHARSAVCVPGLPLDSCVEIEAILATA